MGMLKEAGPAEWFNGLTQDQRYALAGSMIGGTALGGINMLRGGRKNRFKNFLAGAAGGGLLGAGLGYGASKLNAPADPPAEGGDAPTDPPAEGGDAPPPAPARTPPVQVPEVRRPPEVPAGPPQPAPETAILSAAGNTAVGGGRALGKGLLYGVGGAATGSALGAGTAGARAGYGQFMANRAAAAHNTGLTRQIAHVTRPIVDSALASRATIDRHLSGLVATKHLTLAHNPAADTTAIDRQIAAANRRLADLSARMRADVAAAESPLRAAMKPTPSALRPAVAAMPGGAVARLPGGAALAHRSPRLGWAGRAPGVGGILGLMYGTYRGTRDQLSATEGQ